MALALAALPIILYVSLSSSLLLSLCDLCVLLHVFFLGDVHEATRLKRWYTNVCLTNTDTRMCVYAVSGHPSLPSPRRLKNVIKSCLFS